MYRNNGGHRTQLEHRDRRESFSYFRVIFMEGVCNEKRGKHRILYIRIQWDSLLSLYFVLFSKLKCLNISNLYFNVPDYNFSDDYIRLQVNARDRGFERVLKHEACIEKFKICVQGSTTFYMAETLCLYRHPVTLKTGFPIIVNISTRRSEIFNWTKHVPVFS